MENNQLKQINFQTLLMTTELSEDLAKYRILSEFLSNSFTYCFQNTYTSEEFNTIKDKYIELQEAVGKALDFFQKVLSDKKSI